MTAKWMRRSTYASENELYRDQRVAPADQKILEETLVLYDRIRGLHGGPLLINSGRRSAEKQEELRKAGYRAAKFSPHVWGCALDVRVPEGKTDEYLVALLFGGAQLLGYDMPRVGWRNYRNGKSSSTFVHFDFAYLLPLESIPMGARKAWLVRGLTW